jgi:hypothetical protein
MSLFLSLLDRLLICWYGQTRGTRIAILMLVVLSNAFMLGAAWGEWLGLLVVMVIFTAGLAMVALIFAWLTPWTTIEYSDEELGRMTTVTSNRPFVARTQDGHEYVSNEESNRRIFPFRQVTYSVYLWLELGEEVELWQ